ncbi:MAG TPA: helix-turn-helix domain-containing protein [Gaiellaceae bacterium]|jgi:predicted ArsR family transcriptional regulator|nr:helix-turn-helix domain-containing protein [Gaiellaceae bacterium]
MAALPHDEPELHRALADERRRRLVAELQGAPRGLDARELARRLGLHQNTVRWHLGVLAGAGLVESQPAQRSEPGRPRILYSLSRHATQPRRDEYRLLATILAGTVAGQAGGSAGAESAGRAWGRYLVRCPLPLVRVSDDEAIGEVVRVLDEQGFVPDAKGRDVNMRRCPFHDLAEQHPQVVCAVHRGLISGALDELGSDLEVGELSVFVEPDLCVARLARREDA